MALAMYVLGVPVAFLSRVERPHVEVGLRLLVVVAAVRRDILLRVAVVSVHRVLVLVLARAVVRHGCGLLCSCHVLLRLAPPSRLRIVAPRVVVPLVGRLGGESRRPSRCVSRCVRCWKCDASTSSHGHLAAGDLAGLSSLPAGLLVPANAGC